VLVFLAAVAFFKSGSRRQYPALASYLILRLVQLAYLQVVFRLGGSPLPYTSPWYSAYFWGYWGFYLASAVMIFFVIQEVFKRVMEPVPGLRRLGLLVFRWVSIVSVVISVGAIALPAGIHQAHTYFFCTITQSVMRCASLMELCLLAFLALSIHTLGRSFRSRLFGIGTGFGIAAAADMISSAIGLRASLISAVSVFNQVAISVVLLTWAVYFLVPEPSEERKLIVLPPTSAMARWNALAKGIGQTPELAVANQPTGFFLQDIEGVVDRVLAKNPVVVNR
jgi:hypothetical protein